MTISLSHLQKNKKSKKAKKHMGKKISTLNSAIIHCSHKFKTLAPWKETYDKPR